MFSVDALGFVATAGCFCASAADRTDLDLD